MSLDSCLLLISVDINVRVNRPGPVPSMVFSTCSCRHMFFSIALSFECMKEVINVVISSDFFAAVTWPEIVCINCINIR